MLIQTKFLLDSCTTHPLQQQTTTALLLFMDTGQHNLALSWLLCRVFFHFPNLLLRRLKQTPFIAVFFHGKERTFLCLQLHLSIFTTSWPAPLLRLKELWTPVCHKDRHFAMGWEPGNSLLCCSIICYSG